MEAHTSVIAHRLLSILPTLYLMEKIWEKKCLPSHTFCLSVKTPGLCICGTECGLSSSLFLSARKKCVSSCLLSEEEEDVWHLSVSGLSKDTIQLT